VFKSRNTTVYIQYLKERKKAEKNMSKPHRYNGFTHGKIGKTSTVPEERGT
jgi:hypothetical protein